MFLALLRYKQPLEEIEKALPEHILFLDKYYEKEKFIFSGRRNPRVGGIILINTQDEQEVKAIIHQDPFYINDLAEYEVIEFIPTRCDSRFKPFIND